MSEQYGQQANQSEWRQPTPPAGLYGQRQQAEPSGYAQQQYPQHFQPVAYGPPPGYGYPPQVIVHQAPSNGLGIGGFVCGLIGLVFFWIPFFGLVLGLLGLILGGVGISSGRRSGAGTGLAVAGLVLGLISLIPAVIVIAALSTTPR